MRDGTRVVRAGLPPGRQGEPFLPGPTFAAPYHLRGDPAGVEPSYGRYGNPSWSLFERALGELEGGEAVLFGSGMAAASAVLLALLRPGARLVLAADAYMHVRGLAGGHLAERGVELELVPTARLEPGSLPRRFDLLWLETPSNPALETFPIGALAAAAHERGALVAVDNTLATPLGQRPLGLGADLSVTSATKLLAGHSDVVLGYVAASDPAATAALRGWRADAGAIAGPFETWLAHRSLATLELRLERSCSNALALAELLAARDDVDAVRYPGLPADPSHAVARRQMRRFGPLVAFELGSRERAERFLAAARLVDEATSFGGLRTTAERRARWGGDAVPAGFVRLSAGCEDPRDLLDDVASALDASR